MVGFILGQKKESKQAISEAGIRMPITRVVTTPCHIVSFRTQNRDGYSAVVLGYGTTKQVKKSTAGTTKKAGIPTPLRFLREVSLKSLSGWEFVTEGDKTKLKIGEKEFVVGQQLVPGDVFEVNDMVRVIGTSKGKGFQGVVARHGFAGGPRTHGQSDRERAPGSIGQSTTPGRVFKGMRMAGRVGGAQTTVKGLKIVELLDESIILSGPIPGPKEALVTIITQ